MLFINAEPVEFYLIRIPFPLQPHQYWWFQPSWYRLLICCEVIYYCHFDVYFPVYEWQWIKWGPLHCAISPGSKAVLKICVGAFPVSPLPLLLSSLPSITMTRSDKTFVVVLLRVTHTHQVAVLSYLVMVLDRVTSWQWCLHIFSCAQIPLVIHIWLECSTRNRLWHSSSVKNYSESEQHRRLNSQPHTCKEYALSNKLPPKPSSFHFDYLEYQVTAQLSYWRLGACLWISDSFPAYIMIDS